MINVYKDALSQETIDAIIKYFYDNPLEWSHKAQDAGVIKIDDPWDAIKDILAPELSKCFKAENGHHGWIYRHVWQYHMHTDCFFEEPMVNVLIPLFVPQDQEHEQSFMVFDQLNEWGKAGVWKLPEHEDDPYKLWYKNGREMPPCEDPTVHGCTNEPIDQELYDAIGTDTREFFHGLTGHKLPFTPGNVIMFDSLHLHALGKMDSWKMGLVLHFWGDAGDLSNDPSAELISK